MGYLDRKRVQREDGAQLAQYTLTEAGESELVKRAS
jgi:DNA-binding PadR family transcriptional regulator